MTDVKTALEQRIAFIEATVRELDNTNRNEAPVDLFRKLHVAAVKLPTYKDQSKNETWYGLGEPKVDTIEDPSEWTPPAEVSHPMGKSAAVLNSNAALAEAILRKVAATSDKVDALQAAGRRFNAAKAQADLHKVASKVSALLAESDLADPSVGADLEKVASVADHIYGLFAKAR